MVPGPDVMRACSHCHGLVYQFHQACDAEFCKSIRENQRHYHFVDEQHKQNFLNYVRKRLREGMFSKQFLAYNELGITDGEFDQLVAAAGFQFVWIPTLIKSSDKRTHAAMEFPANQKQW